LGVFIRLVIPYTERITSRGGLLAGSYSCWPSTLTEKLTSRAKSPTRLQ